uniref:Uncharacterized protein n=1 Tax=Solanum lycopersicum TaxID=4081 RepID=A0A3Q7F021_SOLLC
MVFVLLLQKWDPISRNTPDLETRPRGPHKSGENGEAVNIGRGTFSTSLNLLSNTNISKDLTDPFSDSAKELVWNIMVEVGKPNLIDYFPYGGTSWLRLMHIHLMRGLVDHQLKKREIRNRSNIDVLDALLNICPEEIDRSHIEVQRSDTTSNTLEWAMAELFKNPHTLEKSQEELAHVIGRGKLIDETDVGKLP